jgi:TPR repeat protein
MCYLKGEGVGRDLAKTEKWLLRAAESGEKDAMYVLGRLY